MFSDAFLAGAVAGVVTDCALHPVDTIKTRLQHADGFRAAGGSKRLFAGVGPTLVSAAPSGATFFGTYSACCGALGVEERTGAARVASLVAASVCGELAACWIRAPISIMTNNMQTGMAAARALEQLTPRHLARVYAALIGREIPFACIQLPLVDLVRVWLLAAPPSSRIERLLPCFADGSAERRRVVATCVAGFVAGGTAALLTAPLDLLKTRVATSRPSCRVIGEPFTYADFAADVVRRRGVRGLVAGATPRMAMISCGGAIFFGTYETSHMLLARRRREA